MKLNLLNPIMSLEVVLWQGLSVFFYFPRPNQEDLVAEIEYSEKYENFSVILSDGIGTKVFTVKEALDWINWNTVDLDHDKMEMEITS